MAWKRYIAFGCSHGDALDPEARDAVLTAIDRWKPARRIHLGDAVDLSALRSGAQSNPDSADRAASIADDLDAGMSFLLETRVTDYLLGNHEHRVQQFTNSPNALKARAAQSITEEIEAVSKRLRARVYPYHLRSYVQLGDTKFLHGFLYNVNAIRDTAEAYGRCVLAHIHRTGIEQARNFDGVTGYAAGMLMQFDPAYAQTRRQTLAWKQGFVFGEYNDQHCSVHIVERGFGQPWRLPF